MNLFQFEEIKALLNLQDDIYAYPALKTISAGVQSAIETFIGRELEYKERNFSFVTKGSSHILLKGLPIENVSELVVDDEEIDSENYKIMDYGIMLFFNPSVYTDISITYTGGYAEDGIPEAIKRAALLQTAYEFQTKDQIGAETISTDGGSVSRPPLGLLPEVKRMLQQFKHPLLIV